jgi:hypothetical protein
MNKTEIQEIRLKLPRGFQKKLAKKTGYSIQFISRVLNAHEDNNKVLAAALDLIEEQKKANHILAQRIKQVAN